MIRSTDNLGYPSAVAVRSLGNVGLPVASVVLGTTKIAIIEAREARRLGRVLASQPESVRQHLAATLEP